MPILIFENLLPVASAVATGAGLAIAGAGLAGSAVVCEAAGAAAGAAELPLVAGGLLLQPARTAANVTQATIF